MTALLFERNFSQETTIHPEAERVFAVYGETLQSPDRVIYLATIELKNHHHEKQRR